MSCSAPGAIPRQRNSREVECKLLKEDKKEEIGNRISLDKVEGLNLEFVFPFLFFISRLYATVRKSQGSGVLRLKMNGVKLENTEGFLRKSDPFFELLRKVDNAGANTWDNVYRSETVMDNLSPDWKEATLELSILCGGDQNLPIQVQVYDYESSGKHVPMGSFETTVNALVSLSKGSKEIALKTKGKETGKLVVSKAEVSGVTSAPASSFGTSAVTTKLAATSISAPPPSTSTGRPVFAPTGAPTFLDYISGGCELNVVVAIDFTGSNGDPRQPGTLHHLNNPNKNDYEKAITSIVGILSAYDSDKKFPVLGFGAKYGGEIQHCFQCGPTEEVYGVQGVLDAYHKVFASGLVMSGPTVFDEVIQVAAARAESSISSGKQVYTVLLIVSDGAVSDPNGTAECLRRCSNAPLSVVIVGVGNADFTSMQFLDDAFGPGERDIAQFVSFNQHNRSPSDLSAATLQEIPSQLVAFFQKRGIQPKPSQRVVSGDIVVEDEEEIDLALNVNDDEIVVSGGGMARSAVW
jgi:hypothetical protein